MKYKALTTSILTSAFLVASASVVLASGSSNCQVVYGGGEVCPPEIKISVNKVVQNPQTKAYVDNLSANDPHYAPTQTVNYKVYVKNIGDQTVNNVVVNDTLPQYLTFSDENRNFSKTIDNIKAGETKEIDLQAKVVDASALPSNQSVICSNTTNNVRVTVDNSTFTDSAQICVETKVYPAPQPKVFQPPPLKSTPSTGPEMLSLVALIPSGALGIFLKKKSK